jgi:hypothetical protein
MKAIKFDESMFLKINDIVLIVHKNTIKIKCGIVKFLNLCKKKDEKNLITVDGYYYNGVYVQNGWNIPRSLFIEAFLEFQNNQTILLESWYNQTDIIKLVELLRMTYHKNQLAHNTRYFRKRTHYHKKNIFLVKIIELAKTIQVPFFQFGEQTDERAIGYEKVILFQFGSEQISFHSNDESLHVPQFKGSWNGIITQKFPLTLKNIHALLKTTNNDLLTSTKNEINPLSKNEIESFLLEKQVMTDTIEKEKTQKTLLLDHFIPHVNHNS